jgi:hypothetical protein
MKKITLIGGLLLALAMASSALFGQNSVEDFPLGTTKMVYEVITEDNPEPQILELTVVGYEDGSYRLSLYTEAVGQPEQLSVFGFMFQAAAVDAGSEEVSYGALSALMKRRDVLEAGQDYIVGSDATFTEVEVVEIATVHCLQGILIDESTPNERMTVAFALTFPVFVPPLILVEEKQDGVWQTTFTLELKEYTRIQEE